MAFMNNNHLFFSGMWLHDMTINVAYPDACSFTMEGKRAISIIRQTPETTLDFYVYDKYALRWWADLGYRGCSNNFGILGKGWICHNCGDYNPSGCLRCFKCGGFANEAFVKPMQFSFYVKDVSEDTTIWIKEVCPTLVSLACYGDNVVDALRTALFDGQPFFKANGYDLQTGYYLCQYCGFGVPEGDTCPGCGGKRMPYSELVKLNRKCVYCGCPSFGALVCDGCGARIKGTTFKKIMQTEKGHYDQALAI